MRSEGTRKDRSTESAADRIRAAVGARYSAIGASPAQEEVIPTGRAWAERLGYPRAALDDVPSASLASFTGIGAPLFAAQLAPGEHVLDLGCGAGLDSILAARQVGLRGHVVGVDFAPGMVAAARRAVAAAELQNVTIVQGEAEDIPVPDGSLDVVLVNGLFNLAPDKAAIVGEIGRILRPGGRLVGAEIVITDDRPPQVYDAEAWFR